MFNIDGANESLSPNKGLPKNEQVEKTLVQ